MCIELMSIDEKGDERTAAIMDINLQTAIELKQIQVQIRLA